MAIQSRFTRLLNNLSINLKLMISYIKDVSSCHRNPANLFEWAKTSMEMVTNGSVQS